MNLENKYYLNSIFRDSVMETMWENWIETYDNFHEFSNQFRTTFHFDVRTWIKEDCEND